MEQIIIYTDGACRGNPGPGGWGAVLLWKDHEKKLSGYESHTTNNRMELIAAIEALNSIKKNLPVTLYTDSQYVKNGITKWLYSWLKSNWKNGTIKNIDLWQKLHLLAEQHSVEWKWVKGHAGNKYNEIADELARDAITNNHR